MAVPKRRTSASKRKMRSANKSLKPLNIAFDNKGDIHLPHHASPAGYYNGRLVVKLKVKKAAEE